MAGALRHGFPIRTSALSARRPDTRNLRSRTSPCWSYCWNPNARGRRGYCQGRSPAGTRTSIVARLSSAVLPLRVAHCLSERIQGGVPGGMSFFGVCLRSSGSELVAVGDERAPAVALAAGRRRSLESAVPLLEQPLHGCPVGGASGAGGGVGHGRVGERLEVALEAFAARGSLPLQVGLFGDGAERDHRGDVAAVEQRVEPAFAVAGGGG